MKLEGYLKLSAKLDDLINFQDPERDNKRFPKTATAIGTGLGLTGAAGYGLYKRGQSMGRVPLGNSITTPGSRSISQNIRAGALAIPGDVRGIISGNISKPTAAAPAAVAPAARSAARTRPVGNLPSTKSLQNRLAKLTKKVKK